MAEKNNIVRIISIESSGPVCSAALSEDGNLTGEYTIFGKNYHDKLLAEFVSRLMKDNGLAIDDIDAVAISAGPGSFTGLRIGASLAKALCFGDSPRLISVPTLSAIAHSAINQAVKHGAEKIISAVPSHKDLIYYQEFGLDGTELENIKYESRNILIELDNKDAFLCGPIVHHHKNGSNFHSGTSFSASVIAKLAAKMFDENKFTDPEEFIPLYIQDFEPQVKRKPLKI